MTHEEQQQAGKLHLDYMRELLEKYGNDAKIDLHADHIRSLLAFASPDKR